MKRRGLAGAAAQVDRIRLAVAGGIEDEPEERLPSVAGEVRAVGGAHHAVPEAVRRGLELDRDEASPRSRPVETAPVAEDSSTIAWPTICGRNSWMTSHW